MLPIHRTRGSVFHYEGIPPGYYYEVMRQGGAIQRFWHLEKFRAVLDKIDGRGVVLDFGCGPGSFLSILAQERPELAAVGVDIAAPQVEFARRVIAPSCGGRVEFRTIQPVSSSVGLPFADGTFDTVTAIEVVEHIHPYVSFQIMSEIRRVLKPNGTVIVTTPNYRSLWPLIEAVLERLSPVKYQEQHISKFTPSSLVKFVEASGFGLLAFSAVFVIAPFVTPLSATLARWLNAVEKRLPLLLGSLLIAKARKLDFD